MYKYNDIPQMKQRTENVDDLMTHDANKSDFWRTGVQVYVGCFPDVSGPDFVINPDDVKGLEIFRSFCQQMAEHYKSLSNG